MEHLPTTGQELKLLRIAADVQAQDLAAAMGIKPSGVSAYEARRKVTPKAAQRYVAALATFATSTEQGAA
jgi:predicted transcriptional regulator